MDVCMNSVCMMVGIQLVCCWMTPRTVAPFLWVLSHKMVNESRDSSHAPHLPLPSADP